MEMLGAGLLIIASFVRSYWSPSYDDNLASTMTGRGLRDVLQRLASCRPLAGWTKRFHNLSGAIRDRRQASDRAIVGKAKFQMTMLISRHKYADLPPSPGVKG